MRTLVIDSATDACSVALFEGTALIAGDFRLIGRGHAEQLVPMVAALPGKGRAQRIAVALGPGSFTGLRVGLAAARALALAWDSELVGYPTLDLVAAMARDEAGAQPLTVAMTGGHGEWFVQAFSADGATTRELGSLSPDLAAACPEALIAGTQAAALVAARGHGDARLVHPDARAFQLLAKTALRSNIALIYGRAPDARQPGAAA